MCIIMWNTSLIDITVCWVIFYFNALLFSFSLSQKYDTYKNTCLFTGNCRSMRGDVRRHDHGARLPGPLRAWYLGHAGGHRVAWDGRWWVVTSARTQCTVTRSSHTLCTLMHAWYIYVQASQLIINSIRIMLHIYIIRDQINHKIVKMKTNMTYVSH